MLNIIEEKDCYTLKFACFSSEQKDFPSIQVQDNLAGNPMFLTDNQHDSRKSRELICNINMTLNTNIDHRSFFRQ